MFNEFGDTSQIAILLDIVLATILSGIVGIERETRKKPAGLRTNMIVGGTTCLIVSLTLPLIDFIDQYSTKNVISSDPTRVLQAVVVGISFLGAGTILKKGDDTIKGLTTAATLLYSLGIGITVSLDQYILAGGVTLLAVLVNTLINYMETQVPAKKGGHSREEK